MKTHPDFTVYGFQVSLWSSEYDPLIRRGTLGILPKMKKCIYLYIDFSIYVK